MHQSVLLQEVVDGLDVKSHDVVVDGTLGSAGHASELAKKLSNEGFLIGIDQDIDALKRGKENLESCEAKVELIKGNFRDVDTLLKEIGIDEVNKILLDLGMSSNQIEESGRGFSFKKEEPLLMTLRDDVDEETLTARRIVNEWREDQIETVLRGYGEEKHSRKIAKAIVERREVSPIETTTELVKVIEDSVPKFYKWKRIHPATKTFQALRIAVNDEIDALSEGLERAYRLLKPNGRIAVISFHSTEDRIVKRFFREVKERDGGVILTKKPIVPSEDEIEKNPRARSAKLRIFEKHD
ncbi:MAG: 16S rRNA (cytosine(1402)-N(4))-methyltransferase RsmH [Candidatus Pacebacteria bacterium]|jgi:16S rRNA (cytosine1402-N4)-methyltransferase|nr:16S rRNA (cytosine(1402)-N(4))-methyltransferase [bacterium]MDP6527279.1 16S rRNA (cytosine(1402)-N(4))-methyltransferase RsmH [Candidatus Paceibacterota bacterium]MDP6659683.1 16S rRNA (cytosine(1402)-N(4))-methyltransferase RsmH [Candidatus Paceibacterota bacterium]|tara:strand:+ start:22526 stop:23419 length:894 start_codon:yes stop_codon:yes gene_type:complete